jgi:hypothetical protein
MYSLGVDYYSGCLCCGDVELEGELCGPCIHVVDVHKDIYWGMLAPHGQSPHCISIVLLRSIFGISQVLRSFGWC